MSLLSHLHNRLSIWQWDTEICAVQGCLSWVRDVFCWRLLQGKAVAGFTVSMTSLTCPFPVFASTILQYRPPMLLNYFWLSLWGTCRLPPISSSSPHQNRIMLNLHALQCISLQLQKSFAKPVTIMACTSTAWPKLWKGLSGYACHMFTVTKRTYCRTDSRTNSHVKTSQQSKNYFTYLCVCMCLCVSCVFLRLFQPSALRTRIWWPMLHRSRLPWRQRHLGSKSMVAVKTVSFRHFSF